MGHRSIAVTPATVGATVPPPRRPLHTPTTWQYEELLDIGCGGMGEVVVARALCDAGFERLVVIKRMRADKLDDEDAIARFVDEARIAADVHHANVVGVQHIGLDDGGYYLVLDYVEGDTLEGLVDRAMAGGALLPIPIVLRVFLDAALGLGAVHGCEDAYGAPRGILHRDVSTSNLLVGRDGATRLSDFGIARAAHRAAHTDPGRLMGRAAFIAPEYARGADVDARIDVYAFGVALWTTLAGHEPWPHATAADVVARMLHEGIPPIESVRSDVPQPLADLVTRCTAHDREDRFASARALHDALLRVAEPLGVASHPDVADLVERLAGPELALRRKALAQLRTPVVLPPASPPRSPIASMRDDDETRVDLEAPRSSRTARRRIVALAIMAGIAVITTSGLLAARMVVDGRPASGSHAR